MNLRGKDLICTQNWEMAGGIDNLFRLRVVRHNFASISGGEKGSEGRNRQENSSSVLARDL